LGLLDYYRRYEEIDPAEVNRGLRERRRRERRLALEHVAELDLSSTEWPELPSAEVANAAIARARGRLNGYPDPHAIEVRELLAARHGLDPTQIALGNGAGELMRTAAYLLLAPGDELITPWPSYPLFPLMASAAGGRPVAVEIGHRPPDVAALIEAVTPRTRVIAICNPNDPTGSYLPATDIAALLAQIPEGVHVLLDEAYAQFQDVEHEDAGLALVHEHPRLFVFRTFSKVYGLSGLRGGYVVASVAASSALEALAPVHGVNAMTQAALAYALRRGDAEVARRRDSVLEGRRRLFAGLADMPFEAAPSEANFAWLQLPGVTGADLRARLERSGILVAAGRALGDEHHVRAAVRGSAGVERLLAGLAQATRSG
jgi:histidinol-phosphate aminotransferase